MTTLRISDIPVEITRKNIRNIYVRVYPPSGDVKVSAPLGMNQQAIHAFVLSKLNWIKQKQIKLRNQQPEVPSEFMDGEIHYFSGKPYQLKIIKCTTKPYIELVKNVLTMYVRSTHGTSKRQQLLNNWYRAQLKQLISPLIKKYEQKMAVNVAEFGIKRMKTRWGTCNPRAKRIWANLELAKKPLECLEYIVVHEMVHLLEPSHNHRFVRFMDQFLPNWRIYKDKLNRQPVENRTQSY